LIQQLESATERPSFPTVAVISPYRHQVEELKHKVLAEPSIQSYAHYLTVNTIDSFQGQERDVVYISMTRSNSDSTIGFLADVRRMNVAMTRARKKLVVIGDSATLSQATFYNDFITYAQQHNGYMSAWELME
jgi:superfamily I DNA and/or RNA helicase